MDSIDRQILQAKSPLEIQDPGEDLIETIIRGVKAAHNHGACKDGQNCPTMQKMKGHLYLSIRAMKHIPHDMAVMIVRPLLEGLDGAPEDVREAIEKAEDLNPLDLFPRTEIN